MMQRQFYRMINEDVKAFLKEFKVLDKKTNRFWLNPKSVVKPCLPYGRSVSLLNKTYELVPNTFSILLPEFVEGVAIIK